MKSSHHGLYGQGYTRATMVHTEGSETAKWSGSQKSASQYGLQSETRLHETEIASNRRSAGCGEYVLGPCTHRPSNHGSRLYQKGID